MREAIFILVVLIALAGLTAFRYRRQLRAVWNVWQLINKARRPPEINDDVKSTRRVSKGLVNCSGCGKWVSESEAVRLAPGIFYCSRSCVERAVETN